MIDTLTSLLTDRLGARWRNYALGSAICFALAGLAIFLWFTSKPDMACKTASAHPWCPLAEHGELGTSTLLVIGFVALIAVAGAVAALAPLLLNALAGPSLPGGLVRSLTERQRRRRQRIYDRAYPRPGRSTRVDTRAVTRLGRFPRSGLGPTRVANALAATRERIKLRYGLDLGLCWPVFVGVLPDPVRTRLAEQSTQILLRAQHVLYVPLTMCWLIAYGILEPDLTPRLIVVLGGVLAGGLLLWITLRRLAAAVEEYADLVLSTVVAQRRQLYQANGFALPRSAAAEPADGAALTDYLAFRAQGPAQFHWPAT